MNKINRVLQISQWIASGIKDVTFDVHPKGHEKINHYRRTHSKKRYVDKILSYGRGGNAHSFAYCGTNPKHVPFNKISKILHMLI